MIIPKMSVFWLTRAFFMIGYQYLLIFNIMKKYCCRAKKEEEEFKRLIRLLKIISEKNRFFILQLLREKEVCVCEIWECLKLSQNLTSHHLKILRDCNLIDFRKEGTKVIYFLNEKKMKNLNSLFSRFIN